MRARRNPSRDAIIAQEEKKFNGYSEMINAEERSHLQVNDTLSSGGSVVGHNTPLNANGLQPMKENLGITNVVPRRSERLRNSGLTGGIQAVKPVTRHVDLFENDKEGASNSRHVSTMPVLEEPNLEGRPQVQQVNTTRNKNVPNLEEKIDYLVQSVDEFKSQGFESAPRNQDEDTSPNFSYKTLYLDTQKKIEALIAENYELIKKLEYARGKVAAYEKMKETAANATKEVLFVKATEAAAVTLSPEMVRTFNSPSTRAAQSRAADPQKKSQAAADSSKGNAKKRKANA